MRGAGGSIHLVELIMQGRIRLGLVLAMASLVAISAEKREGLATLLAKADTTLFAEGASAALGAL